MPARKSARCLRILVVDDNIDQVSSLTMLLGMMGHRAESAINATVALDMAHRSRPDAVLLDLNLPDASGFEVVGAIREADALKRTYLIGITGEDIDPVEARRGGFDEFLLKPVERLVLERVLKKVPQ